MLGEGLIKISHTVFFCFSHDAMVRYLSYLQVLRNCSRSNHKKTYAFPSRRLVFSIDGDP